MNEEHPELRAWFPPPAIDAWRAQLGDRAPRLEVKVTGAGAVDALHLPAPPTRVDAGGAWDVRPVYDLGAIDDIARAIADDDGATSVGLVPHGALRGVDEGGAPLVDLAALDRALAGVDLARTPVAIEAGAAPRAWNAALAALADHRGVPREVVQGFVHACPLAVLARHGRVPGGVPRVWDELAEAAAALPWRTLTLDARVVGEAGGETIDQLTWAVAAGHALLRAMDARGVPPARARVVARFSVGEDVFVQIAALRALRRVWGRLAAACGAGPLYVHAVASPAPLTRALPHTNLVRAAIQGFAAAVGGADAITLLPFDALRGAPSDAALRQTCTAQAVLAWEAGLARWDDPAAGAGLVEDLTERLAAGAWREAQALGDLEGALRSGAWQAKIAARRDARAEAVRTRRAGIVGVNLHVELEDVPGAPEAPAPDPATAAPTLDAAIAAARAGAPLGVRVPGPDDLAPALGVWTDGDAMEPLRAAAIAARARLGRAPTVRLVDVGAGPLVAARRTFARDLLALGGIEPTTGDADLTCLCPADEALDQLPAIGPLTLVAAPPGPSTAGLPLLHRAVDVVDALLPLLAVVGA